MSKHIFLKSLFLIFVLFLYTEVDAFTISGRVIWTDNHAVGVKGVTVNLTGADTQSTITNDRGEYTFSTSVAGDYTLTPSYTASILNGVSSDDATLVSNHVTGSALLADSYKLIASDVNNSTTVTASDVNVITQALGGNPISLNTMSTTGSWKFVPTSYAGFPYPPTGPNNISGYPTTISLTGVVSNLSGNNFIGVKLGDVNATADTGPATIDSATTSKASGTYGVGEVIPVTINFSELVTSTGNVTVTLETGTTDRTCVFTITSATSGTCNYTVQSGDTVSDLYVSTVSGVINDASLNTVNDFTVYVNISDSKDIHIDAIPPVISEVTSVSSFTNDTTPNYAFSTTKAGTISYGGSCASVTTAAVVGVNTVTFNTLTAGTYTDCTVSVTDVYGNVSVLLSVPQFIIDLVSPILSENTPITSPSDDDTPSYAFVSDEIGTISYGGSCGSATTASVAGVNYITFNMLNPGTYSNCTVTVIDRAGNMSNIITVQSFTINAHGAVPVWILQQQSSGGASLSTVSPTVVLPCTGNMIFNSQTGKACVSDDLNHVQEQPDVCLLLPDSPNILKVTMVHQHVQLVQKILNQAGFIVSTSGQGSLGHETTFFGIKTKEAVLKFQKEKKIRVDGVVGPQTRAEMNYYCHSQNAL